MPDLAKVKGKHAIIPFQGLQTAVACRPDGKACARIVIAALLVVGRRQVTCAASFWRSKRTTEVSQRHLSQRLGMALGLTNLLVRRIVAKGWIKVVHIRPSRVRYLLTPAGLAAKARLTREYLESSVTFYAEARERIRERSAELSAELGGDNESKRIVFLGAGQVAEIGHVRLTVRRRDRSPYSASAQMICP
ncbi:MAG TPA: hypothetical protein VEL79_18520 [Vicinamibacterales bacterium]|nr:hypothetical protein [Vicinamibacterales bacterium]